MSNARRLTGVNGRPITAAPAVDEPRYPIGCPDGDGCWKAKTDTGPCGDVCARVEARDLTAPHVFPFDAWPASIIDDPRPLANIDGVLVPPPFADHNRLEWKALTVDTARGFVNVQAKTGSGWYRCGCGWGSGPLDPSNLGRRAAIPQGDAWVEWTEHLPAGFLAFREALVQWRDDHPGLTMPPIGWDGVDRYAWRTWGTPRIDDAGKIVVPRKPDDPPAAAEDDVSTCGICGVPIRHDAADGWVHLDGVQVGPHRAEPAAG